MSEEERAIMEAAGATGIKRMEVGWAVRLAHMLLGCRPIPEFYLDTRIKRMVYMGDVCPVCMRKR